MTTKIQQELTERLKQREAAELLAMHLTDVLASPVCPDELRKGIVDAVLELQSNIDVCSQDFLLGVFRAHAMTEFEARTTDTD